MADLAVAIFLGLWWGLWALGNGIENAGEARAKAMEEIAETLADAMRDCADRIADYEVESDEDPAP